MTRGRGWEVEGLPRQGLANGVRKSIYSPSAWHVQYMMRGLKGSYTMRRSILSPKGKGRREREEKKKPSCSLLICTCGAMYTAMRDMRHALHCQVQHSYIQDSKVIPELRVSVTCLLHGWVTVATPFFRVDQPCR